MPGSVIVEPSSEPSRCEPWADDSKEESCWTQKVAAPNPSICFSLPRVLHKSWLPDCTTGLFLRPLTLSHQPPHGIADKGDEGHAVGEATGCSVGGLMGRLHPRTMALQWGWGLHEWPQRIMGLGGMFTRWLHTWYFTLQQGGNSHLLHNNLTPTKTLSDTSWLHTDAAEMPANMREWTLTISEQAR